jgi:hypothetical protein
MTRLHLHVRLWPIGEGFIEAHHLEPIGSWDGGTPTSADGLIAVCSNCHRMIHRQAPDDIKALMACAAIGGRGLIGGIPRWVRSRHWIC